MSDGVVEQVPDHLPQERVIAGKANFFVASDGYADVPLLGEHADGANGFRDEIVEIQKLRPQGDAVRLRA